MLKRQLVNQVTLPAPGRLDEKHHHPNQDDGGKLFSLFKRKGAHKRAGSHLDTYTLSMYCTCGRKSSSFTRITSPHDLHHDHQPVPEGQFPAPAERPTSWNIYRDAFPAHSSLQDTRPWQSRTAGAVDITHAMGSIDQSTPQEKEKNINTRRDPCAAPESRSAGRTEANVHEVSPSCQPAERRDHVQQSCPNPYRRGGSVADCIWRVGCAPGPRERPNLEDVRTRPQRHPPAPVRVALQAPAALTSFAAPLGCFTAARHITHTSILFHPRNLPGAAHTEPLVVADLTSINSMCPCDHCRVSSSVLRLACVSRVSIPLPLAFHL